MCDFRQVIYLPNLFKISQILPIKINPNYQIVLKDAREWIAKYDERPITQRENSELFCAYTATNLNAERLRVLCDYTNLFFLIDDLYDLYDIEGKDPKKVLKNVLNGFKNIDGEVDSLIGKGTQDALKRFRSMLSEESFKNIWKATLGYAKAEFKAVERGSFPDLETYMVERLIVVGAGLYLGVTDELENFKFSNEIKEDENFQLMKNAIDRLLFITNDIYSYAKELRIGRENTNIVTILKTTKNCSLQEAFDKSGELYEEHFNIYLDLKKNLIEKYKNHEEIDEIKRYFQHCEEHVMGNLEWSAITDRYLMHHDDYIFVSPKRALYYKD